MKEEKLTLRHLSAYMPYGLKCYIMGEHTKESEYADLPIPKLFDVYGLDQQYVEAWSGKDTVTEQYHHSDVFPILRPLSDLSKEINHNGAQFMPMVEYAEKFGYNDDYLFEFQTQDGEFNTADSINLPYYVVEWLLYYHFDVFGLIESGLAIDVNSLPETPYK